VDALNDKRRRAAVHAEAQSAKSEALGDTNFDDASAVRAALRSASVKKTLQDRITARPVQREKERGTLLAFEMRAHPEEAIDLAEDENAAVAARASWKTAVDLAGRAQATAEQLSSLIGSAEEEHARSANQQADYEILRGLAD